MKKFQYRIILLVIGYCIGVLMGMNRDNYFGLNDIYDAAELAGWGFPYGVIGLLIGWAADKLLHKLIPNADTHIKCPDCRELVLKDARKCKHCGCSLIPQ
jgi:hypothetical protein